MDTPSFKELPIDNLNKTGWPWTENGSLGPESLLNNYPKISIITPSFNQGGFLEETIRSVLLQGYPNLEYIIIDGGSTDDSVKIIKKYEPWITYWVSEPDRGQSDALNKGFDLATGDIFGWLNSDDYFAKGALKNLMLFRKDNPGCVAWIGACQVVDIDGNPTKKMPLRTGSVRKISNWGKDAWFSQPSCLFDAQAFKKVGKVDVNLEYAMDVDLWMRLRQIGFFAITDTVISFPRLYPDIKTLRDVPMRQAEHIFIDIKNGLPDLAREKIVHNKIQALDETPYFELLRYFLLRSKRTLRILLKKSLSKFFALFDRKYHEKY